MNLTDTINSTDRDVSDSLLMQKEFFLWANAALLNTHSLCTYPTRHEHDDDGFSILEDCALVPTVRLDTDEPLPFAQAAAEYPHMTARVRINTGKGSQVGRLGNGN